MLYAFNDPDAAGRHQTRYFEMMDSRAIYRESWVAGCLHGRLPWLVVHDGYTFDIGCSTITPVSDPYQSPATFTGTIKRVLIDITRCKHSDRLTGAS